MTDRQLRILVADDYSDLRHVVAVMLRHEGHLVDECLKGVDPVTLCQMHGHDALVLGDPAEETFELIRRLRRSGSRVPVILMSTRDLSMFETACRDGQGVVLLQKPFLRRELLSALGTAAAVIPFDG